MKSLIITLKGMEDIASEEAVEFGAKNVSVQDMCVKVEFKKDEDLLKFCYLSQSCSKVLCLLDEFKIKGTLENEIKERMKSLDLSDWITPSSKFAARMKYHSSDSISTMDLEAKTGSFVLEKVAAEVDLDQPDVIFFVYVVDTTCYLGIDLTGYDLSKRDYKVFSNIRSLRSLLAYAVVKISGYDPKKTLIDPFSGSGEISIEACLYALKRSAHMFSKDKFAFLRIPNFSSLDPESFLESLDTSLDNSSKTKITGFDNQLKNVLAAKKNAKIAEINKYLDFSRVDIDWLETKKDKESVDCIVSRAPDLPKHATPDDIKKLIDEFFYQAAFILKPTGKIVLVSRINKTLLEKAIKYKFKPVSERIVWQGKEKLVVTVFIR